MTVLYLNPAGFSPSPSFTPVIHAAWDVDSSSIYGLGPDGSFADSAYADITADNGATAAQICRLICVTPPLTSTHLWSTAVNCNWVIKTKEASASQNAFTMWSLGVLSNSTNVVRWQTSLMKDGSEVTTTTSASRNNNAGYTASADYTNIPGDRVFVELGWDKDAAVSGLLTFNVGYLAASVDLSTTDGDTGADDPFVNIVTHTFTFAAEGTDFSVTNTNQLMMQGSGT